MKLWLQCWGSWAYFLLASGPVSCRKNNVWGSVSVHEDSLGVTVMGDALLDAGVWDGVSAGWVGGTHQ